jgi:capsular polysaccharide export protein
VYVGTSQAGLEALIQGTPVTCFGLPFYAGWGLTDDRLPIPRRQARPTLEQLVAAAYIRYCRYVNPLTDQRCDVMTVALQLARQKQQDSQFAGTLTVLGAPRRQQSTIRSLLDSRWGRVQFSQYKADLMSTQARENDKLLVWSADEPHDLSAQAAAQDLPLWRLSPGNTTASLTLKRNDGACPAAHSRHWNIANETPRACSNSARAIDRFAATSKACSRSSLCRSELAPRVNHPFK